ncbi:MAG: chorismate synthase [Candidatus Methanomethylophilus sp.]|nr:chorismate synthase [Methanomethylophilus sp.]
MYALGKKLRMSVFGKSHAPCVGCVLEGVPRGTEIDTEAMIHDLALRKPSKGIGTDRVEKDLPHIVTGVADGKADGNPIIIEIMNGDVDDSKYLPFMETPRPGHADLPALLELPKFDITGGGQFSGRLTAPIVAAGSIARKLLEEKGIRIGAFCRSIGPVKDESDRTLEDAVESRKFPTRACDETLNGRFDECIMAARADKDSVGGVVECIITGVPIGFGGIWFESLDAELAHAMFGIPACKGVEFGKGFAITEMRGSQSNDAYRFDDGRIITKTNNMGGIVGGMADGADIVFRVAFKPTPSIGAKQETVNLKTCENAELEIKGRHDPCIAPRAVSVVEAVAALVLADQMERGL